MSLIRDLRLRLYNFRYELAAIRQTQFDRLPYELLLLIATFLPILDEDSALFRQMSYYANNKILGLQYLEKEGRWLHCPRFFSRNSNGPIVKARISSKGPTKKNNQFLAQMPNVWTCDTFKNPIIITMILFLVDERAYNTKDKLFIPLSWERISPIFAQFAANYYKEKYEISSSLSRAVRFIQ